MNSLIPTVRLAFRSAMSIPIALSVSLAYAGPLADYGDAPEKDELLFCSGGAPSSYPSRFSSNGPYYSDITDVWLGPILPGPVPMSTSGETDAWVPNCNDWLGAPPAPPGPPADNGDDGILLMLFNPPPPGLIAAGWVAVPGDPYGAGAPFQVPPLGPPVPPGVYPSQFFYRVTVGPNAPDTVARYTNVLVDFAPNGVYGDGPGERVVNNAPVTATPGTTEVMTTGLFPVTVVPSPLPLGWAIAPFWSRFLASRDLAPDVWDGSAIPGSSPEGEVEDRLVVGDPGGDPQMPYVCPNTRMVMELFNAKDRVRERVKLKGTVTVNFNLSGMGDADHDGLEEVPIEMVSLNLTGSSPHLGRIRVRHRNPASHPNQHSIGEIEEQAPNDIPGVLDILGGSGVGDSYFDWFLEAKIPHRGVVHNNTPRRIKAHTNRWPPDKRYSSDRNRWIALKDKREEDSGLRLGRTSIYLVTCSSHYQIQR